jgi:hypothetical protein
MDGQHASHGTNYAYSALEWPEFYDLWIESLFGADHEDVRIFWQKMLDIIESYLKQYAALSASTSPTSLWNTHISFAEEEITVVDLGTGTGRVVKELVSGLVPGLVALSEQKRGYKYHPKIQFVGIDHGQTMLWRAEDTFGGSWRENWDRAGKYLKNPQWVCASAGDFADECEQLEKGVDLLVFAAGGIGHLTGKWERMAFLGETRKCLKGRESVAVVSVLHEFVKGREEDVVGGVEEVDMRLESRDHTGLVYVKTPTVTTRDGDIRTDMFSVRAVRKDDTPIADGAASKEIEIWRKDMAWSVKLFDEADWKKEVENSGLKIASIEDGKIQRWYFLQLLDL